MKKSILFVDDENQILRALKRLFFNAPYETFYMGSAQDALQLLEQRPIDLIITDIRMPQMDGFELLKIVKAKYPEVLRVALSGYTDSKQIYKAIEQNLAKMYLFKPWDNDEIVKIVQNIFILEEKLKDKSLLETINSVDELPTVPELYNDISKMLHEDEDVEKIGSRIEEDPSIASRILRVANSAFYGAKTGSINQAIMFIGLANVKNIVLSNAVFNNISPIYNINNLWRHAGLTNRISHEIYKEIHEKSMPMAISSAGLLHNIGVVLLITHYPDEFLNALELKKSGQYDNIIAAEDATMTFTHEQVGGYLLNWWELPYPLVEAAM